MSNRYIEIVTCEKPFRKHVFRQWLVDDNGDIEVFDKNPGIERIVYRNYVYYTIYKELGRWVESIPN